MIRIPTIFLFFAVFSVSFLSCGKNQMTGNPAGPAILPGLSYGDSIFYSTNQQDYIVTPKETRTGKYTGFPEGIVINESTGAINVTKSDAGLKYRVSFVASGTSDTISTFITIAGINYLDGFYKLSTRDSILHPVYNASVANVIPGINNGSVFDIGSNCNNNGCTVNVKNGEINLAQTVRNGVFGAKPSNNDRHEFDLVYNIRDNNLQSASTIRVKLYYFDTMNDVTPEAYQIISERQGTILGAVPTVSATVVKPARPRPPCIFIVSR